jgi:ethanolamine ammonia-lyase small subunit
MKDPAARIEDSWAALRRFTDARIALGRAGSSLPTKEVLGFRLAHARARDAVAFAPDTASLARGIEALGVQVLQAESRCRDRGEYLRRPDLGRRLCAESAQRLGAAAPQGGCDLAIVVADGLSGTAEERQAIPLLAAFLPLIEDLALAPVCLASLSRVALGDEIGSLLGARAVLIFIGERPGLSSPDSLGAYLTFAPAMGTTDERRNCVSNIRPAGLAPERAAVKLDYLVRESLRLSLSGVRLKDEEPAQAECARAPGRSSLAASA